MESSGTTAQFRAGPEDAPPGQDKKRKRLATVCLPCRNRKLKCDKEYPACTRCRKSGKPELCSYEEETLRELRQPSDKSTPKSQAGSGSIVILRPEEQANNHGSDRPISRSQILEDRVQLLERLMMQQNQSSLSGQPAAQVSISAKLPDPALIILSLISEFHEFGSLTKEIRSSHPLMLRLVRDLSKLKSIKPAKSLTAGTIVDGPFLEKLLPSNEVVQELAELYLNHVEPIYRLTYLPTFRKQLSQYLLGEDNLSSDLVAKLLLMMATVWPLKFSDQPLSRLRKELKDADPLAGTHDTFNHLKAGYWILCCEEWIRRNKMLHPDMTTLCLQAHVVLARDANRFRFKHEWMTTASLVKMAMSASYHRDSEPGSELTPLGKKRPRGAHHRELQRRIWATVVELDLKASFDKGMPPSVRASDFDSRGPSNIDDEELPEGVEAQPHSHPSSRATNTSLQNQLFKSLTLRLKTCTLVYSPHFVTSYPELAQLENELTKALEGIPAWEEPLVGGATAEFKQQLRIWRSVLKYKIRHCMISLHNRLTLLGKSHNALLPTSPQARVDISADILLHHVTTAECFRRLNVLAPLDCYAQAALTVCHHLYTTSSGFASDEAREIAPALTESLLNIAEKLLVEFEDKAVLTGKGHKEFLLVAVVIALTRIKLRPQSRPEIQQELIQRLATLGFRMLGRMNTSEDQNALPEVPSEKASIPEPVPVPNIVPIPVDLASEYAEYDPSFVPGTETTPLDWSWDFMVGDWASTEFFHI